MFILNTRFQIQQMADRRKHWKKLRTKFSIVFIIILFLYIKVDQNEKLFQLFITTRSNIITAIYKYCTEIRTTQVSPQSGSISSFSTFYSQIVFICFLFRSFHFTSRFLICFLQKNAFSMLYSRITNLDVACLRYINYTKSFTTAKHPGMLSQHSLTRGQGKN